MADPLSLGKILRVHATAYVAAEPVPLFWPMRTFVHNNPLHGLENRPFTEAVDEARRLFHADVYLPRMQYQRYRSQGKVHEPTLASETQELAAELPAIAGVDWMAWLCAVRDSACDGSYLVPGAEPRDVLAVVSGRDIDALTSCAESDEGLTAALPPWRPLTECVDALWGTRLADDLDELMVKSCLDFFDEDQSSWRMPGRERGFYAAWAAVARRNLRLSMRGLALRRILDEAPCADVAIAYVMRALGIAEEHWQKYFTQELMRLHGWAGFIRWRSAARHYYWGRKHPADLVDYLAIRLIFALALIQESARHRGTPVNRAQLEAFMHEQPRQARLRYALYSEGPLPGFAQRLEDALERNDAARLSALAEAYRHRLRQVRATAQAQRLREIAAAAGMPAARLAALKLDELEALLQGLRRFEQREGAIWLRAMERQAIERFLRDMRPPEDLPPGKRPFAQALFCIDVRSELLRRQLEAVGDYQTFGIAGFFGVPVGFLGFGRGSEIHLCPAVLTPKNLVLELPAEPDFEDQAWGSTFSHVVHDLKSSVLAPFVTVEAIGVLFGFDLVGKTLAPLGYHRWRQRLAARKPLTRLLLDKLSREQADSIVRALQRALIVKALQAELGIERERVNDDIIRELRETALGHQSAPTALSRVLGIQAQRETLFIAKLREVYRVDEAYAAHQMDLLGRVGFSLDEQVNYVATALRSIGLTRTFSRFVLLVGHGSVSENNPYEAALDCGACGGNRGLVSARVLAQMANKPEVRAQLHALGIEIPADTWFVPGLHVTSTDDVELHDLDLLPPRHLIYLERLRNGLHAATRLCAAERLPTLLPERKTLKPMQAHRTARAMSLDWSQVRPEWGLSGNLYFVVGRRGLTQKANLRGRSFLQSYDWRCDPKGRLLENLLAGPAVVGQWINMEHYFSVVDNARFGSGSKVYHNVAGRFGVMTGNLSDLRTGLPAQTVLYRGQPFHEPLRMVLVIEAPLDFAVRAIAAVAKVKSLVQGQWIRAVVVDPLRDFQAFVYDRGQWVTCTAAMHTRHISHSTQVEAA
jgi:uncharacterized protein YbcC (UPF0753/DUF2309 family)